MLPSVSILLVLTALSYYFNDKVVRVSPIFFPHVFRHSLASLLTEVRIVMILLCDNIDSVQVRERGNIWVVDNTRVSLTLGPQEGASFLSCGFWVYKS